MRRPFPPSVVAVAAAAVVVSSVPTVAGPVVVAPRPQVCAVPDRSVKLYAEKLRGDRIGYGRTPKAASVPGPTLEMTEGECLAVTLVNHTVRRLSMHAHGVDYTVASDGTRLNRGCVPGGGSRTYTFRAHSSSRRPDGTIKPGSAGYWHYHDHCKGGAHGTDGIRKGLFGAFIVRRPGDPEPDRPPFVVVMGPGLTIGLKSAPNTPLFTADEGERVEFVVIGHGDLFHTFHLHGHRWADNRTGIPQGFTDPSPILDNKTVGPADSFGFQVIAGEGVGPGAWMYHCHVQNHSDFGMSGLMLVRDSSGRLTEDARTTLGAWHHMEHAHTHRSAGPGH